MRLNAQDRYREFARLVNEQESELMTIRGLFRIKGAEEIGRAPVPLDGGRARRRDREALLDRRHVVRLDLAARRTRRWRSP